MGEVDCERCYEDGRDGCTCEWPEPFEDDEDPEDSAMVAGCLFPDRCIAADPYHLTSECWTAEDAEAFFAEQEGK